MSTYRAVAQVGMRAVALIGILPGAIVAAAYLLVLARQLYHHWDARTAVVFGMAAWGVLGVVELWREYARDERRPVSPRAVLFLWALLLSAMAVWKADEQPWVAGFLALVALYSLGRAFGLLKRAARAPAASARTSVAREAPRARARVRERSRARRPPTASSGRVSN